MEILPSRIILLYCLYIFYQTIMPLPMTRLPLGTDCTNYACLVETAMPLLLRYNLTFDRIVRTLE